MIGDRGLSCFHLMQPILIKMTATEILSELEHYGDAQTKNTLIRHGAREPFFGVRVADLKKILRKTGKNHDLSLELYRTGNSDAMYLAAQMADETRITEDILEEWVDKAYWYYLSEFAVPQVAAETRYGFSLGLRWIRSERENVASAGWATLACCAAIKPDTELDTNTYCRLLDQVAETIHTAPNRVRYAMNSFVIAIGTCITDLAAKAADTAAKTGPVWVDMGGTACKVPLSADYIRKAAEKGQTGKKRKTFRY